MNDLEEVNIETVRRNKGYKWWILQERYKWLKKQRLQDKKESECIRHKKNFFNFRKRTLTVIQIWIDEDFRLNYLVYVNKDKELIEVL